MGQNVSGSEFALAKDNASPPTESQQPLVRRLTERDQASLAAFLRHEPGFALFLTGNLPYLNQHNAFIRYWGMFAQRRLAATLMMVGSRAALYAPPGTNITPLARVATIEGADFSMGRADLVEALLALLPHNAVERREEHYLAMLAPQAFRVPPLALPPNTTIRRASSRDLDALTRLYDGTDGFERLTTEQVRRTLAGRLRALRTYVAVNNTVLVSAASTSVETPTAAMIGGVWTSPSARNRGYSTAVVASLARELLRERRQPYLFYLVDNFPAAHVYASVGFHVIGRWSVAYLTQSATEPQ